MQPFAAPATLARGVAYDKCWCRAPAAMAAASGGETPRHRTRDWTLGRTHRIRLGDDRSPFTPACTTLGRSTEIHRARGGSGDPLKPTGKWQIADEIPGNGEPTRPTPRHTTVQKVAWSATGDAMGASISVGIGIGTSRAMFWSSGS